MIISHFPGGAGQTISANKVLNDNDWNTISKVADESQGANYWAVGDTKQITINGTVGATTFSNLAVWVYIIGFDHNSGREGAGRIHFLLGKTTQTGGVDICLVDSKYASANTGTYASGYFTMNYARTNAGGWEGCTARTVLLGSNYEPSSPLSGSLLAALPADLRAVMKPCTKYSDNTGGGSNTASYVRATTDYLWLLSEYEVLGARSYANSAEANYQKQYAYYANGNSTLKYHHNATTTASVWWLRSVHATNATFFCCINSSGTKDFDYANTPRCMAPAFCA